MNRRTAVKAMGALTGVGMMASTAKAPRTNEINLYVKVVSGLLNEAGRGAVTVLCGNLGPQAAVGPVSLKFVTPFFVNAEPPTGAGLAGGNARFLHRDPNPQVPSILEVTFDGIGAGVERTVVVPVQLATTELFPKAPNLPGHGRVIFTADAANEANTDTNLSRNVRSFTLHRERLDTHSAGSVNLLYSCASQFLVAGGDPAKFTFLFGNAASGATKEKALFTFCTPFYLGVPRDGRPANLKALYENADPAIPSIYQVEVAPGLEGLTGASVEIPFRAHEGAPSGSLVASANIVPGAADAQGDLSTAHRQFGAFSISPSPA